LWSGLLYRLNGRRYLVVLEVEDGGFCSDGRRESGIGEELWVVGLILSNCYEHFLLWT
jgi:hypothetical protein